MSRTILHSDMNCFYASVEMLHHPELAGKPMAVGGDPEARHGIVLTANYIAKRAGVKTGMALWQARQVCPEIIFVPPRMDLYLRFSRMAQEIYSEYTDQREPFGIDESWLDVTASTSVKGDGMKIAKEISSRIKYELGVTVSIGVSWNKIFAKLGSDYKKPDAITEFSKDNYKDIAWKLPVGDLLMVGRSTERTMKKLGICTIGDLAGAESSILETYLGKMGLVLHTFAKPYSQTYLKTLHNQLSAIFNHAVRYYELRSNPAAKVGNMGREEHKEMLFWTKEEYKKFSFEMMDKPVSFYAFEMLYWCGIREGELLALTPADFNFDKETVTINKSYQRLKGQDVITSPKTKKSNRTIKMPKFLCEEMKEYLGMLYGLKKKDRIFTVTKSYLHHEMDRGAKAAGVKRIRIHDLRHSHISLLIDMGFSAVAIADRVGHESIDITYQYAHLFPSKQIEMAEKLDDLGKGDFENVS